jgi:phosphoribosyl 1,2-cyclic phosphodiesterase
MPIDREDCRILPLPTGQEHLEASANHPMPEDQNQGPLTGIRIVFYGTRGSIPVCGSEYHEFGGNTTCLLLDAPGAANVGIIDAGTGIRPLGHDILKDAALRRKPIVIAFSHFHWDHIQGLPFFAPAWSDGQKISIYALGRDRGIGDLRRVFARQMEVPYFPAALEEMGADVEFLMPDRDVQEFPQTVVTTRRHRHPGGAYSFRIEGYGRTIVISTDIEHGEELDERAVAFARGADLLIHDAQYTADELKTRRGWGHSCFSQAIECAERAGVKRLILTHHDPDHDDSFLRKAEARCQSRFPNCQLARDGMEVLV